MLNENSTLVCEIEDWFSSAGLPKLLANFKIDHIGLVPCTNCFAAPSMFIDGGHGVSCGDCGKGTSATHSKVEDAIIDWSLNKSLLLDLDGVGFTAVNSNDLKVAGVTFSQYVDKLNQYYKGKYEIQKASNALMSLPKNVRDKYAVGSVKKTSLS